MQTAQRMRIQNAMVRTTGMMTVIVLHMMIIAGLLVTITAAEEEIRDTKVGEVATRLTDVITVVILLTVKARVNTIVPHRGRGRWKMASESDLRERLASCCAHCLTPSQNIT